MNGNAGYRGPNDEYLDAVCWCGRRTVSVLADDVRAGVTRACENPACTPGCDLVDIRSDDFPLSRAR